MRKFLLFAIATMMSVIMLAAGGDGSSENKAIYFDWESGHEHVGTKWYRVDLSQIKGMVDPTLALYLTNLTDESVKVTMNGKATVTKSFFGVSISKDTTMSAEYTIAANDYQLWSQNVKQLLELNVPYINLQLTSKKAIMLSAKKYETSEIVDLACEDAVDFDWNGVQVEAGEKWYRLNLAAVKAQNQKLNFVVANQGSKDATVAFDLSLDCPASVVFGYNWTIPAGGSMTEEFGRVFIDELKEDYVYLKLNTNQALNLRVEEVPAPAPKDETWVVADVLTEGQAYTFSGVHIFEVPMATLSAPRGMKAEFVITNNSGEDATLKKQISFANPVKSTIDKELVVADGATVTKEVVNNMAGVINSETAYIRFEATHELTVQLNYVVVNEEVMNAKPVEVATCEKSQLLDWNSTIKQSGLETKWYEIDLSTIKQNDEHLQLTFTNKSNNIVVVMGEILRACEGDTLPYICPVPAGMSVSQVINYNLFALLPHPKHFYISATVIPTTATSIMEFKDVRSQADLMKFVPKDLNAIQAAEVELTANTISALVDPTACNQATTIARGVKYEQAAGTTKWYRVTDELLNKLSLIPDVAFINNGKQAANITLAASVDCEHSTFGMSTFSLPTWADLTVFPIRLLGDLMDKALNQDVTEMYLQVTTDQPIAFGIDIDYGFGLGCDDAREFDWTKGAVIEKGDAQWLNFDITSVKKNKQQVRLTLTNESNSLAWVAMLTSLTCPFDVALPMVFAIPAGMSIDKVVDYSYFAATKLDQLYVALITEEKISVKAVAEKSQASASDYAACANAVEVKNGEAYVQKAGTTWYKFDRSLFSDVSRLPKFRYAAEATTSLTMGVTVGCEYNIANRGTIKLPTTKGLEVSFRMPGFIYDVLDKFVHDDVEAVYVEMTTDQQIKFGIDMEYAGGCEKAAKLDLSKPLDIDLTANKDAWYYIDLKDVRAMGDEKISFRLNNQSDKAVEVEFEVTPTCPLVVSAIKSVDVPAGVDLPLMVRASMITDLYDQVVAKFDIPDKIANNLPSQLQDDLIYYVRVRANGDLSIEEGDSIPEHVEPGCEEATPLDITKAIDVDKLQKGWYVVDLTTIKTDFSLKLVNNTGSNQTLDFQFYKGCDLDEAKMLENYLTSYNFVVPTSGLKQKVPYSMISSYLTLDELYIYVNKQEGGEVDMACATAVLLDFASPFKIELEEGKEQWFKIAPKDLENLDKNLVISTKNLAGKSVKVDFSLATSCPALATIDSTITVNSDLNRVDSITAGMIDLAWDKYGDKVEGIDTAYIRVLANGNLQLVVDTFTVVIPEVPEGCENAAELDLSKTIKLSELPTGWYHVDLTPLKNGQVKSVSINNDLGQETGVKFDIFRSCEENSFLYTYTHAFKVGLFEQSIPSSALSMLGSIDELYIYITVGVDVLTCEDAIEFDWSKGAVHKAGSTEWYHFDINPIKDNNQQVKLTFTNHSSELAVMYGEVALHCPYTYSIPYACVVPAGMSVDKVIDYSIFAASRVEELYVKVYSSETIELGATTESAEVFDNTPCNGATTVQSGVEYTQQAGTSWYKLPKSLFKQTGKLPKFYFTTEEEGLTKITLGATVGCDHNIATKTIFMLPGSLNYAMVVHEKIFDAWDMLVNDEVTEVYVEVTTDKAVSFSVDMINDTDDPCHGAELLDVTKGINLEAHKAKWYKIDLDALKAMKSDVAVKLINPSASAVTLDMEFSPTCPVVVSLNKSLAIPSISEVTKVISQSTIAKIPGVSFYVRFESTADLQITFSEPVLPDDPASCEDAILLDWTKTINLSELKTGWYKFDLTELHAKKKDFTLSLNNDLGRATVLGLELYETCESARLVNMTDSISEGLHVKSLDYDMVTMMIGDAPELYAYITIDATPVPPTPADGCETAIDYVLGTTITIDANSDVWYAIDLKSLKDAQKALDIKIKNIDNVKAVIEAAIAFACPGTIEQSLTYSIEVGDSVAATVPYSYFADIASDVLYLNLKTNAKLEITVGESTQVTPEVPEGCENAAELDFSKTIKLSELPTGWYHVDLTPLKNGQVKSVSINNDLGQETGVKFDIFRSCEENSFLYTYTHAFKVGLFEQSIPSSALSMLGSIDELYIYITVGVDVLTCEDAIEFDWSKGAVHKAGSTEWYHFDINPIKANNQQVKLTFTNHSSELAVMYGEVALHCPYTYSIPYACVVPAGMSVDKVIDYSIFAASRVEELYVKVYSSETIELGATTESAEVFDNTPCNGATTVQSGVEYTQQAGTSWYKLPKSLFKQTGKLPKFYFTTEEEGLTKITLGATVGCDHNIATKTIFMLPGSLNYAMVVHEKIFDAWDMLVNDEVTEVYVEVTTDKAVSFSVDMINDTDDPCHGAELLDVTKGINLEANKAKWYKIDLDALKAMKSDVAVKLINPSASAVTLDMEFSPTCPVVVSLNKSLAIPSIAEVTKVISQSTIAKIPGVSFYVRFESTADLQITFSEPVLPDDPASCEDAILLDWTKTINLSELKTGWYKFDLTELHAKKKDFTLSLNNDLGRATVLGLELYETCESARLVNMTDSISEGLHVKSLDYDMVTMMIGDAPELYAYITIDATPVPPTPADGCETADTLNIGVPEVILADTDVWYVIDLSTLPKQDLSVKLKNIDNVEAVINWAYTFDCPGYMTELPQLNVAAGDSIEQTIPYAVFQDYADGYLYLNIRTTADIEITLGEAQGGDEPKPEGCEDAKQLDWTKTINLSELPTGWYWIDLTPIHQDKKDLTLSLNNDLGETTNVGFDFYTSCEGTSIYDIVYSFPVGMNTTTVPYSMLQILPTSIKKLYVYIEVGAKLPCEDAILFDWNKGAYQDANKTQWYEFDIAPVLEQEKQVKLTFTNHSNENAWVIAELALNCPYTKSIPIIVPVPANMSVDKWIDYSVFEASRIEHFYMGVTTREAAIELAATWEDARVASSDGCLNATKIETGSLYEHAAGTHWYKLTGDLFDGEGKFSRVHVINRSAKTVNITAGGTVGCEYNIATRTSFKLPRRFDLAFAIPVWVVEQMKKFVDDDVKEFYLELTTDQPIAFSFGMDACEEAIPFDWTTGHTQEALTTQWYDVDIAPVLANEQQIKLTLTNHSNQTAWVATLVSLDCPFKVALPLAFPIPAGMSVDKVIDYSYFAATRLDHLYVGVTTDSKISILAEAQSAEASDTDKDGCANATLLENAKNYTHPGGTAWYKVDGSFLANMSSLPTFRFATVSGETTKVTMGATVGCEYNIATKGSVSVPGGVDLSLRVPSFIFKVLKHLVREDVNEFYVQLTTDKEVEFAIDTTTTEDLTACMDAIDLVVTDSMVIDLAGNTDQWYKVDLSALKGTNKDLAVKAVNPSDAPVNVEVEVSTVCPVAASVIKEATVPASLNVTKVVTAEQIAKLFEKYPDLVYYVRVSTSGDLHAEISEFIPPVDGCADAIDYVWGTDLEVNANEEGWYKLAIVDLRNQDCNIKLTVKNNAADTVTADVAIYETCPIDIPLVSMDDLAIAPTTTRVEEVSADYLPDDVDTVYLHIKPTGKLIVNVSTNCVPDPVVEFAYDTISALICDNSEYISPVSKAAHLISSANASSLTWNDTVHVHATLDSVYTFLITPIVAPQAMTDSLLETIYGTMPLLTPGKVANVDAALIMDYYRANDTESIADVIDVAWKTSTVDCKATTHVMTLVVKDDCGNEITTTHSFPVDVHPTGEIEYAMICDGEDYRWNGQRYDSTGVYSITIQDINGCDSVATLNLTVLPATQFITETKVVCYGESYTWNGNVYDKSGAFTHTIKNALACDSIVYTLQLTVLPQPVQVEEDTVLCYGEHIIWHNMACDATRTYTYESIDQYDCVDTIFTLNVKVLPETIEKEEHVVRCQGETFTWKDGNSYSSTIYGPTYSEQFVGYHCDSVIYTLDLSFIEDTEYRNAYFCHGKSYTLNLPDKDTTFTQEGIYTLEIGSCGKLILNLSEYDSIPVTHEYKTICYGQSFEWNHIRIDGLATNDYTYTTHQGTNGCDSTAVLHVTVLPPTITLPVEKHTMCYGETYKWNAQEYKVSGEYIYVEKNYLGCDSIIHTLNLTVLPAVVGAVEDVTICQGESYTWHGNAYNASGKYEWTLKDINGCDSVVTLNLTVLPAPQNSTELATICEGDSVVWNGATYSQSGVYTTTLQDANGCDYQSTLELVVLTQGQDTVLDKTICYGETYSWYGVTYSTSGTYTDSLDACGATMTLNLTVLPQVQPSVENVTICHGESYTWNGAVYSTAGQFTQTLKDANGCDSVATLNLTVLPATLYEDTQETICYGETYTWIDGVTYDQTASVTYNVPFAGTQCDSLVATLSLTVLSETLYEITNDTICHGETYTWIDGVTYQHSVSGLVYEVPYAGTQCDSLVATLNLTVLPAPQNNTELATICEGDSVVWNGATYSQPGLYTITLQDANGCDYQSTLELVVLTQGQDTVLDKTICYGETYSWYGVTYSTSGTYTDSLDACGATMTLNLTVLPQVQPSVENVTICHGESYTWNGTTYRSSVSTTATLPDVNGCDSVASLNLVVMPAPIVIDTKETICHGETYTWPVNGVTYDQTASVTYNVPFAGTQCDSLVATLNLTVLPATLYEDTQETICYGETYTWIDGVTYDQTASVTYNVPFAGTQCDSLVATLSLTVLSETLYEITNDTICHGETYTWIDGVTYQHSVSGLVYEVPYAGTQCDSLVATLNLTVLPAPQNNTELATICEGDSVVWNGATYSQPGLYTITLQDANGCDYQSTLELVVLTQGQDTVLDKTICYGETYSWYGVTYSTSGTYTDSLDACGATMTLNLTVLPQVQPSVENVTICHGESYTWNGTTYRSSVSTTATLPDVNGCDSVASLNLVVMPAPIVIDTKETICHGETYTWPVNGVTYDQTASVTYHVPFAGTQCDSVINVLNLIVHPKAIEEPIKVATICHGEVYDWNGMQCSVQKTYTHVIPNQSGCDSIIQSLYLVVREAVKPTITNQVICSGDTYTWNNQVYNTTGQYSVTLTDAYGCDSVATLNLYVHDEILPTNEDITICYGDTLTWNGGMYYQTGKYPVTLKSEITDCDSVVTLNLTVLPEIPATTEYMSIPYNTTYTWPVNGMTYGTTGLYSATLSSTEHGCDSVVNLDLTVLPPVLQYEYKTIEDFVCDGTEYEDYITKEQHIISSLVTSTQTWQDTVHVNLELDSIYVFKITPIVAPAKMTDATLATIFGTMPILTPGMMPNVDIAAIKNYYDMNDNDTISDVTKVSWIAASVPCGATTHTMTLVVEDECDNILKTEHIFPVAEIVEATPEEVTICHGETFQWNANNMIYSETNVYKDTLQSAITGCDSIIVTLNLTVRPEIITVVDTTVCRPYNARPGQPIYVWLEARKTYTQSAKDTVVFGGASVTGCDSTVILNLTINEPSYGDTTAVICSSELPFIWYEHTLNATGTATHTLTNVAGCDSIVTLHLTVNEPSYGETTAVICSSELPFIWYEHTLNATGTATHTLTNVAGCDSIVTLHLTVNEPSYGETTAVICSSELPFIWYEHTLNATGTATHTLTNVAGCDSIVTLHLTVNEPSYGDTTAVICSSELPFIWYEHTLNATGTATHTLTNVAGCDSIVTLHLTVNEPSYGDTTAVICSSELPFIWYEHTLNATGTATHTLTNVAGCDSIVTLHLTVNEPSYGDTTAVICSSELPFIWYEHTLNATGTAAHTLTNVAGCDSIVTLHLTVNEPSYGDTTAVICSSELPFIWYEHTLNATGTATHTLTNVAGCDSIVTLHLTVNEPSYGDTTAVICSSELPFIWYEHTLNATGTATHTLTNVAGCDSIVTLHLTVNEPSYGDTTAVICSSELPFIWYEHTLNATGTATHTLTNVAGCDSIVTLHLTVNEPSYGDTTAVICSSELPFIWYEHTLNATGTATHTLTNVAGCDSIVTLHLTVNEPSYGDTTAVICSSELPFIWYEHTLNATGTATHTLTNVAGCDSIVTLHLTVNEPSYGDTTAVICSSELPFIWYEHTLNATGTAAHTLTNVAGCDSIVTLHLIINEPSYGDTTAIICSSELPFIWYEHTLNATGTATHTLTNVAGCDSIVTLHLTVNEPSYGDTTAVICSSELPFIWYEHTLNATGTATHTLTNVAGCDSIVTLHLTVLDKITLPNVTAEDIVAICGKAIDVTTADAIIQSHIAAYDWVENVVWEMLVDGKWVPLTSDAIDGGVEMVTIRYTILTACEDLTDTLTVVVENPNPENSEELANAPAYNKYGGRLLTLDLQYIVNEFGWNIAEEDVTWYLVVEGGDDIPQGTGYYLTTEDGAPLPAGNYYALIERPAVLESDCEVVLQTVILVVETQVGPLLAPTVARPLELIRLMNLNPDAVSTIYMYSAKGELLDTFQTSDKKETTFHAAQTAGYYIVEVQTATEKVSLRYIVK